MGYSSNQLNTILNSPNFCKKNEFIEIPDVGVYDIEFLINSNYDENKGFSCNGDFSIVFKNEKNAVISSFKADNFNKTGFRYVFDKSDIPQIAYDSDDSEWRHALPLLRGVEFQTNVRKVNSVYLRDLDFLYDDYFYILHKSLSNPCKIKGFRVINLKGDI